MLCSFLRRSAIVRTLCLPDDDALTTGLPQQYIHTPRSIAYLFRRFENHGRKNRVIVLDYTIERILPQTTNLVDESTSAPTFALHWKKTQPCAAHLNNCRLVIIKSLLSAFTEWPSSARTKRRAIFSLIQSCRMCRSDSRPRARMLGNIRSYPPYPLYRRAVPPRAPLGTRSPRDLSRRDDGRLVGASAERALRGVLARV